MRTQPPPIAVRRCGITIAKIGVVRLHRHHDPPPQAIVAFEALDVGRWPRGWALVGRPVSRHLQAAGWLEVTRVATDGAGNACSALYAACARWARRSEIPITTYTLASEGGSSLRGAGWIPWARTRGGSWAGKRRTRARVASPGTEGPKIRWIPRWAAIGPEIAPW